VNTAQRQLRPLTYRILRYLINGVLGLACASGRLEAVRVLKKDQASLEFFLAHVQQDFGFICKLADKSPEVK
jgi:hypothetical protein